MSTNIQKFDFQNTESSIKRFITAALLWQYNNAPIITSLITQKATWYNTNYSVFWADWYRDVFNLKTCNNFGITVWCIILQLPIQTDAVDPPNKPIFGFGPDTGAWTPGYAKNFGHSNFSEVSTPQLNFQEKRFLLQLRFFQLHSDTDTLGINAFLPTIIGEINNGSGTLFVFDNLNMTVTYTFTFTPRPVLIEALEKYDVLPRASGVKVIIVLP